MSNAAPQAHFAGNRLIGQQYLNLIASQNSCLLRYKPISSSGKVVSQLEDPISQAMSLALFWSVFILVLSSSSNLACSSLRCVRTSVLAFLLRLSNPIGRSDCWDMIAFVRTDVALLENSCSWSATCFGDIMPIPPRRTGNDKSSFSSAV